MKTLIIIFIFLLQQPTGYVNDEVGLLQQKTIQQVEQTLSDFEKQTEIEIAVLIRELPENREAFEYAVETAETWGIGKKGADNGIFIYLAPEARKWQILVGYGLEGFFTDAEAGRIGRKYIIPNMRESDPDQAVISTTAAIIETLGTISMAERQRLAELAKQERQRALDSALNAFLWVLAIGGILFFFIALYIKHKEKKKELEKQKQAAKDVTDEVQNILNTFIKWRDALGLTGLGDIIQELQDNVKKRRSQKDPTKKPLPPNYIYSINQYTIERVFSMVDEDNYGLPKEPLQGLILADEYDASNTLERLAEQVKYDYTKSLALLKALNKDDDLMGIAERSKSAYLSVSSYTKTLDGLISTNLFYENLPEEAKQEREEARDIMEELDGIDDSIEELEQLLAGSEALSVSGKYEEAYNEAHKAVELAEQELDEQRREEREKLRRRRRQERYNSYHSSSSYSTSSGGSGFGGFGGGSFGGAGAGGSW